MSTTAPSPGPDRSAGTFLAAAVGDALGWPQEDRSKIVGGNAARTIDPTPHFRDWVRHGGTRFAGYLDPVRAGEYSDDTQLMLAVARSCLRGSDWWHWLTKVELPQWPYYERGGGGAVLRAARSWARGREPWLGQTQRDEAAARRYFEAGGNGVAMRIAPHAIVAVTNKLSSDDLGIRVLRDGLSTHGHPQALVGGVLHAAALHRALAKSGTLEYGEMLDWLIEDQAWARYAPLQEVADQSWHDAQRRHAYRPSDNLVRSWEEAVDQTLRALQIARQAIDRGALADDHATLEAIGCFDRRRSGAGTVAAVAALYVASRSASRPISGLLRTAFLHGSDTDTIASMTGSLLGAMHGTSWLGALADQVQDGRYLAELAWRLTGDELQPGDRDNFPSVTESTLKTWTKNLESQNIEYLPDGRKCELMSTLTLEPKGNSRVTRSVVRAEDGQTLLVDRVTRRPVMPEQPELVSSRPTEGRRMGTGIGPPHSPVVSLSHVEMRVQDLDVSERFYSQFLGLGVNRANGRLILGNGLQMTQLRDASSGSPTQGLVLTLIHPDPALLAARAAANDLPAVWAKDMAALWLQDPDGNPIRVTRQA